MAGVIERAQGRYEVQDVEFGRVYRWRPEQIFFECDCGAKVSLTVSEIACRCRADHAAIVREELAGCSEDETLHPWRYARDRGDARLPY